MMASARVIRLSCIFILTLSTNVFSGSGKSESDDLYIIRSQGPHGFVLDATEAEQVRIQHFTGSDLQLWKFQPAIRPGLYYIINEHHDKALDYGVYEDGLHHVNVKELKNETKQTWSFDFKGNIVNAKLASNIDIHGADYTAGKHLILVPDNGCTCQLWILQKKS